MTDQDHVLFADADADRLHGSEGPFADGGLASLVISSGSALVLFSNPKRMLLPSDAQALGLHSTVTGCTSYAHSFSVAQGLQPAPI